MSDQDPFHQETTRTTVVQPDPLAPGAGPVRTQETIVTDRQPNQTAWWIAGIVAVLAIIAVLWMVLATAGEPAVDPDEVQDAIADARLQGQLEGAQDSVAAAAAAADRAAESAARSAADAVREPPVVVVSPPAPSEPAPPPAEEVDVVVETPAGQ